MSDTATRRRIKRIKQLCDEYPDEVLAALLEQPFWPQALQANTPYTRVSDDNKSQLGITFSPDGDAWARVWQDRDPSEPVSFSMRFRTFFGGGESLRVRNALLMLAVAITIDNAERPQDHRL